jgi:hypothetical protein
MRIMGIRIEPPAGVLAIAYAIFGLSAFVFFRQLPEQHLLVCGGRFVLCHYGMDHWSSGIVLYRRRQAHRRYRREIFLHDLQRKHSQSLHSERVFTLRPKICHTDH